MRQGRESAHRPEVVIEIFELRAQVRRDRHFGARAEGPARQFPVSRRTRGIGGKSRRIERLVHRRTDRGAAIGEAAGQIAEHRRRDGIADASTHRSEMPEIATDIRPGESGRADGSFRHDGAVASAAVDATTLDIRLEAEDDRASLPIVADLAAAEEAFEPGTGVARGAAGGGGRPVPENGGVVERRAGGRDAPRSLPGIAVVEAHIEALPSEGWRGRDERRHRPRRQIRRPRRRAEARKGRR